MLTEWRTGWLVTRPELEGVRDPGIGGETEDYVGVVQKVRDRAQVDRALGSTGTGRRGSGGESSSAPAQRPRKAPDWPTS